MKLSVAVVLALFIALPVRAQAPDRESVKKAVDAGIRFLREAEKNKGDFEHLQPGVSQVRIGGVTALSTLALLEAGVPADDPLIQRCLKYLRKVPVEQTYTVSLQVMVYCKAKQAEDRERVIRGVEWLEKQQVFGGWGYSEKYKSSDLSNTEYALLALHAARKAGYKVEKATFEPIHDYLKSYGWGVWGYRDGSSVSTNMTAAGLLGLHITCDALSKKVGDLRQVTKGFVNLDKKFPTNSDEVKRFPHFLYTLHTMSRLSELSGRARFGHNDWFAFGRDFLLQTQKEDGSWERTSTAESFDRWPVVATSFSVIFLAREPGKIGAVGTADLPKQVAIKDHGGWVSGLAFSPDGKHLAVGGGTRVVSLFDASKGEKVAEFKGHTDFVPGVAVSPDGERLAAAGYDGTVRLFDLRARRDRPPPVVLRGHRGVVMTVAFHPKGTVLASGGHDGTIRLWDPAKGEELAVLKGNKSWVNGLAFDQNGAWLASAGSDGTVRLWDLETRKELMTFEEEKPVEVRGVALSPDGMKVATAIRYGKVKVWDVKSGKAVATLDAHKGEAWAVAFSPDGKTLASGGGDWAKRSEARLWDVNGWREVDKIAHGDEVLSVAFSPDGKWLAVGGRDGVVTISEIDKRDE